MSSERQPGEAGIVQSVFQDGTVPVIDIVPEENAVLNRPDIQGSGVMDRLRNRWTALVAIGAAAVAVGVSPIESMPAYATSSPTVTIGMPFAGKWAYPVLTAAGCGPASTQNSHPSCHEIYSSSDWTLDAYAAAGTEVKLKASGDALSFSWDTSASGTCGETRRINILSNNVKVGDLHVTHLNNAAATGSPPTNGMTIGKIANLSCNPGGAAGKHVHMEFDNDNGTATHSCYVNHSTESHTAGQELAEGTDLGILGSSNDGTRQACASAPPPPSLTPYNMNVKFDADTLSDLVVSRYAGGLVVGSGAPGSTLIDTPPKISLTNWPIPKWAGTGDFNGDGSTDVLVEWPSGFGVALGHPNGIFSEGGVTLAGRSSENWAGVGNFYKNDGADTTPRADLVVARPGGGFVVAYGMPNGTLADGPISLPDWTVQSWAGVGDFNGDNYSDILVAKPASAGGGFALALGHPDGQFTFGGNELPGWSPGLWAATGNFAGDAKHDLVVAKPGGGFAIAHPNANGTLREGQESLFGWSVSSWAGTADIDGNGYTDILIARPEGGFAVALADSTGIFKPGPVVALPGWGVQNWAGNGAFVGSKGYGYVRP